MMREQPAQLPLADPEAGGEPGDVAVVQGPAFDEAERAGDGRRGSHPARRPGRGLGTAAQAGPEAGRLGRCGAGEEEEVLAQGRPGRTDGPAVDAGRPHADEEAAVEPGVPGSQSAIADLLVEQRHGAYPTPSSVYYWRFSDADAGGFKPPCSCRSPPPSRTFSRMIRKLKSGRYRLYSRKKDPRTGKRKNLGTFKTLAAAKRHERAVQFFKRR